MNRIEIKKFLRNFQKLHKRLTCQAPCILISIKKPFLLHKIDGLTLRKKKFRNLGTKFKNARRF